MCSLTSFMLILAVAGCGGAPQPAFFDQTYEPSYYGGYASGAPPADSCVLHGTAQITYVRFGSDGVLSLLSTSSWEYVCGSQATEDEEQWTDRVNFCKTLTYDLDGWTQDDAAAGSDKVYEAPMTLDNASYGIENAIVDTESHEYTLVIDDAGALVSLGDSAAGDYGFTAPVATEPDWSDVACVPEDFSATDRDAYEPEIGTGEPYEDEE